VLDRAVALGFDAVCTGHHARLDGGRLRRSVDAAKDQSYVLAVLNRGQLDRALFPSGGSTKDEVRAEAAQRGLAVADKPDSHDVCFIPTATRERSWPAAWAASPGASWRRTEHGSARMSGTYGFTIGQRKGLRVGAPAATAGPVTSWTSSRRPGRSPSAPGSRST
jgi:tRNA-specific 2-thiouridylase